MAQIQKGYEYDSTDPLKNVVTDANLNSLVANATLLNGAITEQFPNSVTSDSDIMLLSKGGSLIKQTKGQFTDIINSTTINANSIDCENIVVDDITVNDSVTVGGNVAVTGTISTGGIQIEPSNFVPAGAVMPFAMNVAPSGWLKCSGQAVSRTTYATLFALIGTTYGSGDNTTTFNLPDLRAEFIRGWDDGRTVDNGRVFGSSQQGSLQSHKHTFVADAGVANIGYGASTLTHVGTSYDWGGYTVNQLFTNDGTGTLAQSGNATGVVGTETRPRNIALLYCIKY